MTVAIKPSLPRLKAYVQRVLLISFSMNFLMRTIGNTNYGTKQDCRVITTQTFLPYPNFSECAKVLDNKRLGKQRVEAYQVLRVLAGMTKGWRNHPAVLMWEGHERCLAEYGQTICKEWIARGFSDTLYNKIGEMAEIFPEASSAIPSWLGDNRLHESHKSNLLRKDLNYYSVYFREIPSDLPYFWVTRRTTSVDAGDGKQEGKKTNPQIRKRERKINENHNGRDNNP